MNAKQRRKAERARREHLLEGYASVRPVEEREPTVLEALSKSLEGWLDRHFALVVLTGSAVVIGTFLWLAVR